MHINLVLGTCILHKVPIGRVPCHLYDSKTHLRYKISELMHLSLWHAKVPFSVCNK